MLHAAMNVIAPASKSAFAAALGGSCAKAINDGSPIAICDPVIDPNVVELLRGARP